MVTHRRPFEDGHEIEELAVADANGEIVENLGVITFASPAWTSDGERLAYVGIDGTCVYAVDDTSKTCGGTTEPMLLFSAASPVWSYDDEALIDTRSDEFCIMRTPIACVSFATDVDNHLVGWRPD